MQVDIHAGTGIESLDGIDTVELLERAGGGAIIKDKAGSVYFIGSGCLVECSPEKPTEKVHWDSVKFITSVTRSED